MLAPMLGNLTTQVGQMMSTAIMASSVVGAVAGQGALGGMQNAANQMSGAATTMAGAGMAGASALGGLGRGSSGPIPSGQVGLAGSGGGVSHSGGGTQPMAFGGNTTQQSPMSFGEKFKTYAKAGLAGGTAGLAAGSVQAATQAIHIPQVGRPIAGDILQAGNLKGAEIGQTGVVNHNLNFMDSHMKSLEPSGYTQVVEKTVIPETQQQAPIIMNPGTMVNEMDYVGTGHNIIENPSLQQKYLEIQELKKVIVIRPMLGDKIQKKLWPKKYVQHGISNLFRLELSDGWRLLYTVTHQGKTTFCIILDICDHKEYEKLFRY